MVLYVLSHEKVLLYRPLRQGMGLPEDPCSSLDATRHDAYSFPARDLPRLLLRLEKRLSATPRYFRYPWTTQGVGVSDLQVR
jgi:hypothetical protein